MIFEQYFLEGLAHASYLVGCEVEKCCAIIDPQRDIDVYLKEAESRGLKITHSFVTHLHADFVAGHCELAARLGAEICLARAANVDYAHLALDDASRVHIGTVVIEAVSTPGHTPESMTFYVYDSDTATIPKSILTGDTLFVGDVGRVDLLGPAKANGLARQLYDSVYGKLLSLPDEVEVFPTHGAGSLCARVICDERSSTIGRQRQENYALKFADQDAFVDAMVEGIPEPPVYFARMVRMNREGPRVLGEVLQPPRLTAQEVQERMAEGAVVVDARSHLRFGKGHIPGSYSIGGGANFSTWAGWVLPEEASIILLAKSDEDVETLVRQLIRVGCDEVVGYLGGGFEAWSDAGLPTRQLRQVSSEELNYLMSRGEISEVVDVRADAEWEASHIEDARHIIAGQMPRRYAEVSKDKAVAVICAAGYRSNLSCSILLQHGYDNVVNVRDGMNAWLEKALPVGV